MGYSAQRISNSIPIVVWDQSKLTLSGKDAGNYKLADYPHMAATDLRGAITKREVTLKASDFEVVTKAYDGTTTAVVKLKTGAGVTGMQTAAEAGGDKGLISGYNVTLKVSNDMFKFNSKDVGSANKLLIASIDKLNAGITGSGKRYVRV